jgi:hypothetical protein
MTRRVTTRNDKSILHVGCVIKVPTQVVVGIANSLQVVAFKEKLLGLLSTIRGIGQRLHEHQRHLDLRLKSKVAKSIVHDMLKTIHVCYYISIKHVLFVELRLFKECELIPNDVNVVDFSVNKRLWFCNHIFEIEKWRAWKSSIWV